MKISVTGSSYHQRSFKHKQFYDGPNNRYKTHCTWKSRFIEKGCLQSLNGKWMLRDQSEISIMKLHRRKKNHFSRWKANNYFFALFLIFRAEKGFIRVDWYIDCQI